MKNVLKAFGVIALAAIIGFSMAACGGDDDGDGGDKRDELKGIWEKDGSLNGLYHEYIEYAGRNEDFGVVHFRGSNGRNLYNGILESYDGTTVKVVDSPNNPYGGGNSTITFTAKIANGKLTVSGLSTVDSIDISVFNGTYTKQPKR